MATFRIPAHGSTRRVLSRIPNDSLQHRDGSIECGEVLRRQCLELPREHINAPRTATRQQRLPPGCGADAGQAPVAGIRFARDESLRLEGAHEAGHRRRAYLFGGRELAERERTCEDNDREGG